MNTDLISRQAVLDLLFNSYIKTELTSIGYASKEYAELCVDELNELPLVNPQEPKTGHWIDFDYPWFRCSECGAVRDNKSFLENYCPNCGAKMLESEADNE